ncbi:MAG: sugar transferase [Acidimicrobiales bacterium]
MVAGTPHLPGPAIFVAKRVGQDGEPFNAYKFRSMVVNAEELLEKHLADDPEAKAEYTRFHKLRNDPRVTRVGRVLRATSL